MREYKVELKTMVELEKTGVYIYTIKAYNHS